jgi:predicted HTH transcriptional regulator
MTGDLPWEDGLLERKVESDLKDLLKTVVAFANSVRPGHKATILIGERDDGSIQGVTNPDRIQQKVRETCNDVYPDIVWDSEVYEKEEGKFCVRVEIEYSGNTPHFGGPAWVRDGASSVKASAAVFQKLIDIRSDPVFEMAKWVDKAITIAGEYVGDRYFDMNPRWPKETEAVLKSVNRHWATFDVGPRLHSEPVEKLILTYDDVRQRLKLLVKF